MTLSYRTECHTEAEQYYTLLNGTVNLLSININKEIVRKTM